MSTVVKAPTAVISNAPREIIYKSKVNVPGPGHYHYEKPNVSPIILTEAR